MGNSARCGVRANRPDTALILGDALTVLVTHAASEEMEYSSPSVLSLVAMGCWIQPQVSRATTGALFSSSSTSHEV
jgi:hypothetical protein